MWRKDVRIDSSSGYCSRDCHATTLAGANKRNPTAEETKAQENWEVREISVLLALMEIYLATRP